MTDYKRAKLRLEAWKAIMEGSATPRLAHVPWSWEERKAKADDLYDWLVKERQPMPPLPTPQPTKVIEQQPARLTLDSQARLIIRERELLQKLGGVSGMSVRRWEKECGFPRRFKLNPNGSDYSAIGWDADEVDQWISERLASRDGPDRQGPDFVAPGLHQGSDDDR